MNILIVGAGEVGKLHGYYLYRGGAKITFFVKEKYEQSARGGFRFVPLNNARYRKNKSTPPLFWDDYEVISNAAMLQDKKWDYIILAMSSTALRSGWLPEFLSMISPGVSLIILQPGLHDKDYVLQYVPAEQLIDGTIHLVSHENSAGPSSEFWFPPGSFAGFSGEPARVSRFVAIFKGTGFAAKVVSDARKLNVAASPALTLTVFGLKQNDFSFSDFLKGPWLDRVVCSIPEAVAIQARKVGVATPATFFLNGIFFKFIFWLSKFVVPFDFENHLRHHFLKVDDQMREMLVDLIVEGEKENLPVKHLQEMLRHERKRPNPSL